MCSRQISVCRAGKYQSDKRKKKVTHGESGDRKEIISRIKKEPQFSGCLLPFVKTIKEFAELTVLFPYVSMTTLCFSLTTGYLYLTTGPQITARKGYIEVRFDEDEFEKNYSVEELEKYLRQKIVYYGIARQGTAGDLNV